MVFTDLIVGSFEFPIALVRELIRWIAVPFFPEACVALGVCEPVSSLSHLAAAALAIVAAVPLVRAGRRNWEHKTALAVYATCVVLLLAISGTYHSLTMGRARLIMQHADYLAIWTLIAGTFTGIHGVMCRGFWRRWILLFVWIYAAIAIVLQVLWFKQLSGTAGLVMYLALGWVGLATIMKLGRQLGFRAVSPILIGGLLFSGGAVLEAVGQPVISRLWLGPHEIFHFAVIAAVTVHWLFIRRLVLLHAASAATTADPSGRVNVSRRASRGSRLPQCRPGFG